MLKKLLTGCLTIAMIGAFSASASAEADFTWTGNVTAGVVQTSKKAAEEDAETIAYTDMSASGDLDLSAKVAGDVWTGEAKFELDWNAGNTTATVNVGGTDVEYSKKPALEVDDLYVVASKEGLDITFGEFDPFGIGKGIEYVADIDETLGAGGIGSIFAEKGLLMVGLPDVGLNLLVGMNKVDEGTGEAASETTFGGNFDKTFGDFALAVGYYSVSRSVNTDDSDSTEDVKNDGFTASEIALAAQYTLGEMAFTLNYTSQTDDGGNEVKNTNSYIELAFDMGIGENAGITVVYAQKTEEEDDDAAADPVVTTTTDIHLSAMFKLGPVENYVSYYSSRNITDVDDAEAGTDSQVGYMMKVPF